MLHIHKFEDETLKNELRLKRERILKLSKQADKKDLMVAFILAVSTGFLVAFILVAIFAPYILEAIDNPGWGSVIFLISLLATIAGYLIIRSAKRSRV